MSTTDPPRLHRRAYFKKLLTGGARGGGESERRNWIELHRRQRRSRAHPLVALWRPVLGWLVILVGLAGVILPLLPAIVIIPFGVWLVGRRATAVRFARTRMKLLLRHAETWSGWWGRAGRILRERERRIAKFLRDRRIGPWERPSGA